MYRPKDWPKFEVKYNPLHCFAPEECTNFAYEEGADAMLEGLKEDGKYIDASKYPYGMVLNEIPPIEKLTREFKGWIIIIPEEVT